MADKPNNSAFDRWCYTAIDDRMQIKGKPVPLLTTLLYRVCGEDQDKFDDVLSALQAAFEAGQRASKTP